MLRRFDFGRHMALCIAIGLLQLCAWLGWWCRARRQRPHAWLAPAISVALHLTLILEVCDFPPIGGVLDAHALWHASTVPLAHLFWRGFVEVELRWLRERHG